MSGAKLLAAVGSDLLRADLVIGDDGDGYGFVSGSFGSLTPSSYTDRSNTSRTILQLAWTDSGNLLGILLSGTAIPNSNNTFAQLATPIGGLYLRSAATYDGNVGGNTLWSWSEGTNPLGASGTVVVRLI